MKEWLTIAMPVCERADFFREALESALNQQPAVKVLVVDNASQTFDFQKVIAQYPGRDIEYHRNTRNLGMHENWNQCIRLCATPYVLILHDDDVLEPGYLTQLAPQFDPNVDFYWCKVAIIDAHGRVIRREALDYGQFDKPTAWCLHNGAYQGVIMRCVKAKELGLFNPRVPYFLDWDLYVKFILTTKTRFIPYVGVRYRISEQAITAAMSKTYRFCVSGRLQIKRNFSRAGLWAEYRQLRFSEKLPVPTLRQIFISLPQLSPRRLRYLCQLITRTNATTTRRFFTSLIVNIIGWRGVTLVGKIWRGTQRIKQKP